MILILKKLQMTAKSSFLAKFLVYILNVTSSYIINLRSAFEVAPLATYGGAFGNVHYLEIQKSYLFFFKYFFMEQLKHCLISI